MLGTIESLASLTLALVSFAGLVIQDRREKNANKDKDGRKRPRNFVLITVSLLVVILFYFAAVGLQQQRAILAAQADVVALLTENGPMSFEDIYAQISPRRDLTTLTAAIDAGLSWGAISASPERATLADNNLVGIRLYQIDRSTATGAAIPAN